MADNSSSVVWKVLVPHNLLTLPYGTLIGHVQVDAGLIYVAGVCDSSVNSPHLIGKWTSEHNRVLYSSPKHQDLSLHLIESKSGQISCHLIIKNSTVPNNCIIFCPDDLKKSYFITNEGDTSSCSHYGDIGGMFHTLIHCMECWETGSDASTKRCLTYSNIFYYKSLLSCFITLFLPLNWALNNSMIQKSTLLRRLENTPAIGHQLSHRCSYNQSAINMDLKMSSNKLKYLNVTSRQVMDTCLGMLLMLLLMHDDIMENTATFILSWADHTADQLTTLLHWLMGAPAGLKLNTQLTEFLGQFFLYHIYLWKGYLSLLQPVLGSLLWYSLLIGGLGFTAQVCLLQDILSMMTLHIYCFYVYAARLYRLQVYTLSALWRLFRGKKWNMLRRRVDSSSFDVDQLFIGTLLFTILLFMLPTTTLYYTVFTLLRMAVLLVQGVLCSLVEMLNNIHVYSLLLWIVRSRKVAGDVLLYAVPSDEENGSCVFFMQICSSSLRKVVNLSNNICSPKSSKPKYSWGNFFRNLVKGHLVYPWIDLQGGEEIQGSVQ